MLAVAPKRRFVVTGACEAAAQLLTVLNGLQPQDSGSFRSYTNDELPW